MSKINSFPSGRQSRREALGLLFGTPFLAQSALGQEKQSRIVVIVYNGKPDFDKIFQDQHLSRGNKDRLVIVNMHSEDVCVLLEESKFEKSNDTIGKYDYKPFSVKATAGLGKSRVNVNPGACSKKRPEVPGLANGEIIIDQ